MAYYSLFGQEIFVYPNCPVKENLARTLRHYDPASIHNAVRKRAKEALNTES